MSRKKINVYLILILALIITDCILYFNFSFGYDPKTMFFVIVPIASVVFVLLSVLSIVMKKTKIRGFLYNIADWGSFLTFTVLLISNVFMFFIRPAEIINHSMEDTLYSGDRVLTYIFNYKPQKNDIVPIFMGSLDNDKTYVKRIAAVADDVLRIEKKSDGDGYILFINEEPFLNHADNTYKLIEYDEWYVITGAFDSTFTMPEGKVLAFGDNYDHSSDSRAFGLFDEANVKGKVIFRLFGKGGIGVIS